jgi:hypothetical protein
MLCCVLVGDALALTQIEGLAQLAPPDDRPNDDAVLDSLQLGLSMRYEPGKEGARCL